MAKGSLRVNGIIVDTDGEIKASTGDAIVIREDDGSAVITVDTSGNTLINGDTFIGGNTSAETIVGGTPRVQVEGVGYADSSISVFSNSNDTSGSYLFIGKSRGTALSADTIVQDGDFVGGFYLQNTNIFQRYHQRILHRVLCHPHPHPLVHRWMFFHLYLQ